MLPRPAGARATPRRRRPGRPSPTSARPASSRSPRRDLPSLHLPRGRQRRASPATTSRSPRWVRSSAWRWSSRRPSGTRSSPGLDAGRFDMIANQVSITDEREADYDFSKPYTVSPGVIVVNEGDDSISSFDDLEGKTTAQSLTSNWYTMAEDSGAKVESVEGWGPGGDAAAAGPRGRHRQRRADLPRLRDHRGRHRPGDRRHDRGRGPQRLHVPHRQRLADQGRRQGPRGPARRRHAGRDLGEVLGEDVSKSITWTGN